MIKLTKQIGPEKVQPCVDAFKSGQAKVVSFNLACRCMSLVDESDVPVNCGLEEGHQISADDLWQLCQQDRDKPSRRLHACMTHALMPCEPCAEICIYVYNIYIYIYIYISTSSNTGLLVDGCPSTNQSLPSVMADPYDEVATTVNCCSDAGECSRKHEDRDECIVVPDNLIISGNFTGRYNYYAAALECASERKRLCTKDELLSSKAAGCCSSGCGEDHVLVWTKTVGNNITTLPTSKPSTVATLPSATIKPSTITTLSTVTRDATTISTRLSTTARVTTAPKILPVCDPIQLLTVLSRIRVERNVEAKPCVDTFLSGEARALALNHACPCMRIIDESDVPRGCGFVEGNLLSAHALWQMCQEEDKPRR